MKAYLFVLVTFLAFMQACTSVEKVKTTKVYIEVGAPQNQNSSQVATHQSKKAYSGYQHKTKVASICKLPEN